eukprot:57991_1
MSRSQVVQDLTVQLEVAEQEIKVIGLENNEYLNEIYELKEQNSCLMEANASYFDCVHSTVQREQHQMTYLRSVSLNLDAATLHNDELNTQISEYQATVKRLTTQNKALQQKNSKYHTALEQIHQNKQRQTQICNDRVTILEDKIQTLQGECDELREEVIVLSTPNTCEPNESPVSVDEASETSIFRLKATYSMPKNNSQHMESEIVNSIGLCDVEESNGSDIMTQWVQFGYTNDEISVAMEAVTNRSDINEIVECIENRTDCEYNLEMEAKVQEIKTLKSIQSKNARKIDELERRIQRWTTHNHRRKRASTSNDKGDYCLSLFSNWFG